MVKGGPVTVRQWSCIKLNRTQIIACPAEKRDFLFKRYSVVEEKRLNMYIYFARASNDSTFNAVKESETKPVCHVLEKINTAIDMFVFILNTGLDYMNLLESHSTNIEIKLIKRFNKLNWFDETISRHLKDLAAMIFSVYKFHSQV